jgi:hypothetical protein
MAVPLIVYHVDNDFQIYLASDCNLSVIAQYSSLDEAKPSTSTTPA